MMRLWKRRLLIGLGVLGPGLITAIADNDAGGVATYSVVGAKFGYSMLFILLVVTILLAITQEMGARLALVAKRGLGDMIREKYGIRVAILVFTILFIANMGSIIANFAGIAAGLALFHVPVIPFTLVFMILIMLFVAIGNYQTNQKIFLTASFLFVAYIISAILAKPDWNEALKSLVLPHDIQFTPEYIYAAIALMGTTITPWGQFFISSYINDKKLHLEHLKYEQFEIWAGAFITDFFAFFIIVAVAATLHVNGISIVGADDAALAIKPFAGEFAGILFGIGLLTASYMGAVIIPLTTAYAFSEFFGTEGSLDLPFHKSRMFYGIFLIQIVIAFFAILIPGVSLFQIVLFTQGLNGVLLPFIIYFLLKFTNDKEVMGEHTNKAMYNIFATISAIVIVIASVFVIVAGVLGLV